MQAENHQIGKIQLHNIQTGEMQTIQMAKIQRLSKDPDYKLVV